MERAEIIGGWAWEPDAWLRDGANLIRQASEFGLNRLYVTLLIDSGRVRAAAELIAFIRAAGVHGISIEAVEGDPDMVTQGGLRQALMHARAIGDFLRHAPADGRLAEVQYDVEPYTHSKWGVYPYDYRGWALTIRALAATLDCPLHLVLPFWIAGSEAGRGFLGEIAQSVSSVTAMAYRTDCAAIVKASERLLSWGLDADKHIRVALEAGPVAGEGATNAAAISFLGDEGQMFRAAERVRPSLSMWSSFAGFSYHGINWAAAHPHRPSWASKHLDLEQRG